MLLGVVEKDAVNLISAMNKVVKESD
jgi:hypothetical protein